MGSGCASDCDWAAFGARLARLIPREALEPSVATWLEATAEKSWGVACSGGLDSVAMALLIEAHFRPRSGSTAVLHFNHRLRGAESEQDAAFVRELAAGIGARVITGVWEDPPADPSEASARHARWKFFEDVCRKKSIVCVLLGHHLDDVAESILMRVGRGSGPAGLAAPRPIGGHPEGVVRLRPFIEMPRDRLASAMRKAGVPWREDASNLGRRFTRNRLRLDVLPAWKAALTHDWSRTVGRTRRLCEEDAAALAALSIEMLGRAQESPFVLLRDPLRQTFRAVARRAVERWVRGLEGLRMVSAAAVDAVLESLLSESDEAVQLGSWRIEGSGSRAVARSAEASPPFFKRWLSQSIATEGAWRIECPGRAVLSGQRVAVTPSLLEKLAGGAVDPAREVFLSPPNTSIIQVRFWQCGDRYCPFGASGTRKVQDLFTDLKIPRVQRHRLPVVTASDGAILWIPGLPPSEYARVLRGAESALRLTYFDGSTPSE